MFVGPEIREIRLFESRMEELINGKIIEVIRGLVNRQVGKFKHSRKMDPLSLWK